MIGQKSRTTNAPAPGAAGRAILARGVVQGFAGFVVLYLLLVLPAYTDEYSVGAFVRLPIELPILMLVLFAAPPRARRIAIALVACLLGLLVALKAGNLAIFAVYARPFNAFLHLHLVPAGLHLLAGAIGSVPATLAVVAALASVVAAGFAILVAVRALAMGFAPWRPRVAVGAAILLLGGYGVLDVADVRANGETTATATSSYFVRDQVRWHWQTFDDLARFRAEMTTDSPPPDRSLSGLGKSDVLLVFIESYGRSAIENPSYAPAIGPTLRQFDGALEKAGFAARSAWLASPVFGGQSWLAHTTLLSGLRVDGQGRYDALVLSGRRTLIHDFQRAGWDTVAVVPGITTDWPDGRYYGYQRIHAAADLGYAGQPFGWISMPDQFTLSALDRLELNAVERPKIMATVILISSHAPWTPLPTLEPWERIGDGTVFGPAARTGDAAEVVWTSGERIRGQYAKSIDYVLQTLTSYVTANGGEDRILIVLGDHQPIPFVSGTPATADVPIHIIARDSAVLAALDEWGWSRGMTPDAAAPTWPMEAFRGRLVETFTPAVTAADSQRAP